MQAAVVARTDKHGSKNGRPTLQVVMRKEDALDLIVFSARNSEDGVHVWWCESEQAAWDKYRSLRETGQYLSTYAAEYLD